MEAWNKWLDNPVDAGSLGDRGSKHWRRRSLGGSAGPRGDDRARADDHPVDPAETVHELRKDAKKLRYLIECFGGLYAKSARTTFVARLKSLQDTLGEHQDAEVHTHALRTIADDPRHQWDADTPLAIGQLIERLEQRRLASRGELAERFDDFDQKGTRKALKELLASEGKGRP